MALHARDGQFGLWRGHSIPHAKTDTILNHKSLGTLAWAFYYNGTTRERPTTMLNRTLAWAFYSSSTHLQFERLRDFQNLLSDRFQEKFQEKCRFQESAHAGGQKTCSSYPKKHLRSKFYFQKDISEIPKNI